MKLSELKPGTKKWACLGYRILAVLSRREDGWCIYVGPVDGKSYDDEWRGVADHGDKQYEDIARAIANHYFAHEIDLPYAR